MGNVSGLPGPERTAGLEWNPKGNSSEAGPGRAAEAMFLDVAVVRQLLLPTARWLIPVSGPALNVPGLVSAA